jgi:hypothetical protein
MIHVFAVLRRRHPDDIGIPIVMCWTEELAHSIRKKSEEEDPNQDYYTVREYNVTVDDADIHWIRN